MENENNNTIFAGGVRVFQPRTNAPEWVLADVVVDPKEFVEFLKAQSEQRTERGEFRFQLRRGRSGNQYLALDTFKPKPKEETTSTDDFAGY